MRSAMVLLLSVLPVTPLMAGILPGDSARAVRDALGPPNGSVAIGQTEILFFDRGEVVLRDGRVIDSSLMSEDEVLARQARDDERRALLARVAEDRRRELEAEGSALKQAKVDSLAFQSLSASERAAFWRQFQRRYPMVPVDLELGAALTQAKLEETERERLAAKEAVRLFGEGTSLMTSGTRTTFSSSGWAFGAGIAIGRPHPPGHPPVRPVHPIYPGRPPGGTPPAAQEPNPDFRSTKGEVMSTMDRARGNADAGYNASRSAIYRSISP